MSDRDARWSSVVDKASQNPSQYQYFVRPFDIRPLQPMGIEPIALLQTTATAQLCPAPVRVLPHYTIPQNSLVTKSAAAVERLATDSWFIYCQPTQVIAPIASTHTHTHTHTHH